MAKDIVVQENDWGALHDATPLTRGKSVQLGPMKATFYPINMLDLVAAVDEEPEVKDIIFGAFSGDEAAQATLKKRAFGFGADAMALIMAVSSRRPQDKDKIRTLPQEYLGPAMKTCKEVVAPNGVADFFGQFVDALLAELGVDGEAEEVEEAA